MKDLLTHYAEIYKSLSNDFLIIKEKESLYNKLIGVESPNKDEKRLLYEADKQIVNWNSRVDNVFSIYKSLVKTYDLIISDPSIYHIKHSE